jgi:hypothetical protein
MSNKTIDILKEYIFENVLNSNIEIRIKANSYSEALDMIGIATNYNSEDYRYTDDKYRLIPNDKYMLL